MIMMIIMNLSSTTIMMRKRKLTISMKLFSD